MNDRKDQELPRSTLRISMSDMLVLRVRTGEKEDTPELLYQHLPEEVMPLLATIPSDTSAVSIPQSNGRWPISRTLPNAHGGILIVYARKPNNRYEAIEIIHAGRSFGVDQFITFARQRLKAGPGRLTTLPGRFAYFSPTRDELGAIQRDGGYAACDPSVMAHEITPEIQRMRQSPGNSGLIVRIPVQTGAGGSAENSLPTFVRVEMTNDPQPSPASPWTGFVEFQRSRSMQSCPPESVIPLFRGWVESTARECGFQSWHFQRGMFCGDHIEWWGRRHRRRTLHEGIDFAQGLSRAGEIQPAPEGAPVRALADGDVVAILDDFLNKTVVVKHPSIRHSTGRADFYTLYSHIHPAIPCPGPLLKGHVLGNIEKSTNAGAPGHLHLTAAWIPESMAPQEITMDLIHPAYMPIVLVNMNSLVGEVH